MRMGNSVKPFEHFLQVLLAIVIAANLTAVILLCLGVIKRPSSGNFGHTPVVPAPANFVTPPPTGGSGDR